MHGKKKAGQREPDTRGGGLSGYPMHSSERQGNFEAAFANLGTLRAHGAGLGGVSCDSLIPGMEWVATLY